MSADAFGPNPIHLRQDLIVRLSSFKVGCLLYPSLGHTRGRDVPPAR